VRLPRLFNTTSFRLAALFTLIFGISTLAVGTFIFVNVKSALNRAERTHIQSDALALKGEFDNGGMSDLMDAIRNHQNNKIAGAANYSLFRANGKRIWGTMPPVSLKEGWKHMSGPPDGDEPKGELEHLLVYRVKLSPDLWLVVGDDIGRQRNLGQEFLRVFAVGILLALGLTVIGGVAVSLTFLRQIDSIARTAEAIIEGDIGQRISITGSGDDLDRLAATLNRMLDRISMLMDSLRHVSNDIAHDLRTPLGHLRHILDDAQEHAREPAEYRTALALAIAETDSILETFAAILRIAQIESGSRRARFQRVDLSQIVANVVQSFAPTAEEQGHPLISAIDPHIEIDGDRELITQLVANLIDNAIRHTPSGSRISAAVHAQGRDAILEVSDNGRGVPYTERKKIFERFYRGEASRTTPGNGLGLSLANAVAMLHRARIAALENSPGLKVRVEFPVETDA